MKADTEENYTIVNINWNNPNDTMWCIEGKIQTHNAIVIFIALYFSLLINNCMIYYLKVSRNLIRFSSVPSIQNIQQNEISDICIFTSFILLYFTQS